MLKRKRCSCHECGRSRMCTLSELEYDKHSELIFAHWLCDDCYYGEPERDDSLSPTREING